MINIIIVVMPVPSTWEALSSSLEEETPPPKYLSTGFVKVTRLSSSRMISLTFNKRDMIMAAASTIMILEQR